MHGSTSGLGVQTLNLVAIFIIIWILFDPFFQCLLLSENVVILCLFVCWQNPIERKCIVKRFKWLNGKRIQTHRRPCSRPNPMQVCAWAWIYRWAKNCGKSGTRPRAAGPGLRAGGPWATGRGSAFCKTLQTQQQLDLELPQILAGESDSELNSEYTIHSRWTLN